MEQNNEIHPYKRTKNGLIAVIHGNQLKASRGRGHVKPNYSLTELRCWALSQPIFHKLYDDWVVSGFRKKLTPSFDRMDDSRGYCLSRLEIMTWDENNKKHYSDIKSGVDNRTGKPVIQLTKSGEFVKKFHSSSQAGRETGANQSQIIACCRKNGYKSAGGFRWEYA